MKIAVGMSGGVDSSVAALLLQREGHEVTGITMLTWDGAAGDPSPLKASCYGPDEADDARMAQDVCRKLKIPFLSFDCSAEYRSRVLNYFRSEYAQGRTPNPCVVCNQTVKFGVFPQTARQSGLEFERFATGHYARVEYRPETGRWVLMRAVDAAKDQSYFLHRLSQQQLSELLLPLGRLTKSEVRELAAAAALCSAEREESQDFYAGNYQRLLQLPERPGDIVNRSGEVLGRHKGVWNYTVGQRKGLRIARPEPLYVVGLDAAADRVIVGGKQEVLGRNFEVQSVNWVSLHGIEAPLEVQVRIRSAHRGAPAVLRPVNASTVQVEFNNAQEAITPGQSAVFYAGDDVVGGGIIETTARQ